MIFDEYADFPDQVRELLQELRDDPNAKGLMQSLCVIPDVRDLSYDPRRALLSPDSVVQRIIYEVLDDVTFRDRFVETLMKDYVPPPPEP